MNYCFRLSLGIFLFFSGFFSLHGQEIKLLKSSGSCSEILTELVKIHKLNLSFNPADCDSNKQLKLPESAMNVEEILSLLCKRGGLQYQKVKSQYIISKIQRHVNKEIINNQSVVSKESKTYRQTEMLSSLLPKCSPYLVPDNLSQQTGFIVPLRTFYINENLDTMKIISKKSTILTFSLLWGNFVFAQSEWGINAGINSSAPFWLHENLGFYGGVNYKKSLPWNFKLTTSLEFFRKVTIAEVDKEASYSLEGNNWVQTSFENLEIKNSFYGLEIPMVLFWQLPTFKFKPFIGGGLFWNYSLFGNSKLAYSSSYNSWLVEANRKISWNNPTDGSWVQSEGDRRLFQSGASVMNRNNYGWLLQVGVSYQQFDIHLTYSEGLKEYVYYYRKGQSYNFKLTLCYNFNFQPKTQKNEDNSNIQ